MIKAKDLVGTSFPPEEGSRLATVLLDRTDVTWSKLTIDLSELPSSLLISAFFNAFLQAVFEKKPELLPTAKSIDWQLKFDFQKKNVQSWMDHFTPFTG